MQNSNKFYNFFIYSDTGACLYKLSSEKTFDMSLQGIFQALFYTSSDLKFDIKTFTTDFGLMSYKPFNFQNKNILLALVIPNYFGDEELADLITENILDYLYSALVTHIGLTDLYNFISTSDLEILKKFIEIFEPTLKYILSNFMNLNLMLKSEKKYEINKEILYPIKHYLENFKNYLKIDFLCLTINSSIVWASPDW